MREGGRRGRGEAEGGKEVRSVSVVTQDTVSGRLEVVKVGLESLPSGGTACVYRQCEARP